MEKEFYKTKTGIQGWLKDKRIKNYTLIPDSKYGFVIDVIGDVMLNNSELSWIPIKFSYIKGNLYCPFNNLESLEFCPSSVGGDFYCSNNKLTSLEFCPSSVGGTFDCANNQLTSLKYCPKEVGTIFNCYQNQIINLEFCPQKVGSYFLCNYNKCLDKIQGIADFQLIYQEHINFTKQMEYDKLNTTIEVDSKFIKKNKL